MENQTQDFSQYGKEMREYGSLVVESFSQGKDKLNPNRNEDIVLLSSNLLAIIDGATSKGTLSFGKRSGGQYAAHLVAEALLASEDLFGVELTDFITEHMRQSFQKDGYLSAIQDALEARPTAVFLAAKIIEDELVITQLGDVSFRINASILHNNFKEIDAINALKRKDEIERLRGEYPYIKKDELLELGRAAIAEDLNNQVKNYQNNPDTVFGYGALDGRRVSSKFIRVFRYGLETMQFLEIFSDGYFKPAENPTVESWEDAFRYVEVVDPDKTGSFPSTKGSSKAHFADDRSVIIAKFGSNNSSLRV